MCCSQAVDSLVGFHEESMKKKKRKNLHQGKVVVEKPQRKQKKSFCDCYHRFQVGVVPGMPQLLFSLVASVLMTILQDKVKNRRHL